MACVVLWQVGLGALVPQVVLPAGRSPVLQALALPQHCFRCSGTKLGVGPHSCELLGGSTAALEVAVLV